ncbi:N-acetyltransferase family protein [Actinosynnema sp. CA-248983]
MPNPRIRPATTADAAEIARIHVEAWRAAYAGHMPEEFLAGLSVADRRPRWERQLATDASGVFVVEHEGAVAGFAVVGPSGDDDADPGTGELHAINLDPAHWHHGLGRPLLDHVVATLQERGYHDATLWVLASNDRARRFYARAGWSPDGTTRVETIPGGTAELHEVRYRRPLATATVK